MSLRVRHFGTENTIPHVHPSALHLLTCSAPDSILHEAVTAAGLQVLSLAEADTGTRAGMSIFNSIW